MVIRSPAVGATLPLAPGSCLAHEACEDVEMRDGLSSVPLSNDKGMKRRDNTAHMDGKILISLSLRTAPVS